jgi:hypothetical protein
MINADTRIYLITGITPLLGSQPPSPDIRTKFLAAKAAPENAAEEEALVPDLAEKNLTVFLRDPDANDRLVLMDYVVRGFLKEAVNSLKSQVGVGNARSKVDKYLFVEPRRIPIRKNGKPVYDEDDYFERPIRCQTMQGERVTLTGSEQIYDPWQIKVRLTLIPNAGTVRSAAITWDTVEAALDYGQFMGLGQFRTGSYGRFRWEEIKKEETA